MEFGTDRRLFPASEYNERSILTFFLEFIYRNLLLEDAKTILDAGIQSL